MQKFRFFVCVCVNSEILYIVTPVRFARAALRLDAVHLDDNINRLISSTAFAAKRTACNQDTTFETVQCDAAIDQPAPTPSATLRVNENYALALEARWLIRLLLLCGFR